MTEKEFYQECLKSLQDRVFSLENSIRSTRSLELKAFWTMKKGVVDNAIRFARARLSSLECSEPSI